MHGSYLKTGEHNSRSEVIELRKDAIVRAKEDSPAALLFVPSTLHATYLKMVKARRLKAVMEILTLVFANADREELKSMAEFCSFREFKMNNHIYRAGLVPRFCYVVVQGSVKIESPGTGMKKSLETAIVG